MEGLAVESLQIPRLSPVAHSHIYNYYCIIQALDLNRTSSVPPVITQCNPNWNGNA